MKPLWALRPLDPLTAEISQRGFKEDEALVGITTLTAEISQRVALSFKEDEALVGITTLLRF